MTDIEGLVSDPDFRKLPEERQRLLLENVGASPEFINQFTGFGRPLQGATISSTPEFQKPVPGGEILSKIPGPLLGKNVNLPSPEALTDFIPGVAGAVGGLVGTAAGGPAGAVALGGLASGGGEAIRQEIRKLVGFAPGTGVGQEILGLDPDSAAARALGVANETIGGTVGEALPMTSPGMRRAARRQFARAMRPDAEGAGKYTVEKLAEIVEPIEQELPVGTRGMVTKKASREIKPAGQKLAGMYNTEVPTEEGFRPAAERLRTEAAPEIRTPEFLDPATGEIVSPDFRDEKLFKSLMDRAGRLEKSQAKREGFGMATTGKKGKMTIADLWNQRKMADLEAERARAGAAGLTSQEQLRLPKVKATQSEREALREMLHDLVPNSKETDDVYHAWATVLERAPMQDVATFIQRWFAGRAIPGKTGTVVGLLAARPASYRTLTSKIGMKMANLLEAGKDAEAMQLFRGFVDSLAQPDTKPLESEER